MTDGQPATTGMGFASQRISGWGRFPVERCNVFRPERQADVARILISGGQRDYISHGLGRSYGDAPLNYDSGVIWHCLLNRFLSFDEQAGVIECEAGVSLAEIIEHFLPRGFFLPVTPGTKFVTIGGAVAANVHGKNHHKDGAFASFLLDLRLLTPSGETIVCSRSQNSEIFWATVGGMGLTGIILSARFRLCKVESAFVFVDYEQARNLEEALSLMDESDEDYQYSVAWIDCLAQGDRLGRSILMRGNHAGREGFPAKIQTPLALPPRRRWNLLIDFPSFALNNLSVRVFNSLYYGTHGNAEKQLVDFESFFYPLDAIRNWNRLYGKRGFVQFQLALPQSSGREGLLTIVERLARSRRASFLAVLKRFGRPDGGLLSFPIRGYTLALDLPVNEGLVPFLHELERVVIDYGGRIYLAKDAVTTAEGFAAMYPQLGAFRAVKQRLDPGGRLSSSLARRLGIVEE